MTLTSLVEAILILTIPDSVSTVFPKTFSSSYKPPPVSPSYPTTPAPTQPPASGGYGEGQEKGEEKKELCVDVSSYEPVVWVERNGEECRTEFVQQCEERSENVCDDVTETICEVPPVTNQDITILS